ncbi:phosphonate metabolism transcriptional regulator PhnF [Azospirillum sp. SYSU D00513]|uniref:phosphonate metabolism transcriptional regulator PhnF n=1 Tax=Azospirillum sp. SYSU D00513 TaxID=2812561 RepID=UPI001FFEF91F|nr:phosphonate metabolism transcriptional regulator PhnF [Azospirillum sp. SYSU D00513]
MTEDGGMGGMNGGDLARGAGTALWRQIAERIEADILKGLHPPGEKLPTEHALAESFGVNRHTARRAVLALAEKGLVRVEQGRGTFVQESVIDYRLSRRTRFSENLSAERREAGGQLLGLAEAAAEAAVARALGIAEGAEVIVIERLGEADGRPVNVSSHYFPKARVPGLAEAYRASGSISAALTACGVADYTRRVTRITARPVRSADARLLQQAPNRPILLTESINVDAGGEPIEYSVARWASDRVQLVVEPNG